jgi:hypothetical protein
LTLLALLWRPGAGGWRLRLDAALYAAVGLTIMISAIATSNFNYRYTAVLYYTLPIAAAIALTHLTALRARRATSSPATERKELRATTHSSEREVAPSLGIASD